MSAKGAEELNSLLHEYKDVLRIRLGNVGSVIIEVDEKEKPFKAKARRYPPEAREYMDSFGEKILE